jgi:hypothetical protein
LIEALDRRTRGAVCAAAALPAAQRDPLLRAAERDARGIERERTPWGDALALVARAGIAATRGDVDVAVRLVASSEQTLQGLDMALHAAGARRQRGRLIGGDEGTRLVADADRSMREQRIQNPERVAAMLCPGVWG